MNEEISRYFEMLETYQHKEDKKAFFAGVMETYAKKKVLETLHDLNAQVLAERETRKNG